MGLLDALADDEFRGAVGRGLLDAANRGAVAGLLGAPVDAAAAAVNLPLMAGGYLGHQAGLLRADQMPQPITAPVMGSEWLGQRMQDAGMVSAERNPLAEALAAVAVPGAMARAGAALPVVEADNALALLLRPTPGSREAMRGGPIAPDGKARLLADLQAGEGSGRYRLGDVTEGQRKGLDRLFGSDTPARDVHMTDEAFRHILERRLQDQRFSPEEIVRYVEQAMARRARPDINPAKGGNNPSLLGPTEIDLATGRRYEPRMPLRQTEDGYEPRSVVPEGLRPRKQ